MARILFLLDDDFEDAEFAVPYERLVAAGHECVVAGTNRGQTVFGKRGETEHEIEAATGDVIDHFDALVLPGGYSPDKLRTDQAAVEIVGRMVRSGRLVAAICHAGSLLVEADVVADRTVTSWPSIRTDLLNAGAQWVDAPVVVDDNIVTSRRPDDLDEFVAEIRSGLDRRAAGE